MWKNGVMKNNGSTTVASAKSVFAMNGAGDGEDDDWETDPDYVNEMSEEQQRWGGARDTGTIE